MIRLKLTKLTFDTLENHDPYRSQEWFFEDDQALRRWFKIQEPEKMYVGWDNEVYPKYIVTNIYCEQV